MELGSTLILCIKETWTVIEISAPWLLGGFFLAGLMHGFIPTSIIKKNLQKPGLSSVIKSSLFGIPLPLCSCSVIPLGVSLRRSGASKGSTASFFISTPEIGVDSCAISYALLGPVITAFRVIAAFISAIFTGFLIDTFTIHEDVSANAAEEHSCCHDENEVSGNFIERIKESFHFAFVEMFDDLAVILSFGFIIAGVISALVPAGSITFGDSTGITSMLIAAVISAPLYVCATSSTPLAAAFLAKGLNPGAALVFLLAGPATNVTTMLAIKKELGLRSLIIYISTILIVALGCGYILNSITWDYISSSQGVFSGHDHHSPIYPISGVLVSLLLVWRLFKRDSHHS